MCEIKFRAWDKKNEEMRFGYPVIEKGVYKRFVEDITGSYFGVGINNGNYGMELMQFTGFKDKNGKEIFEGDLVKHCSYKGKKFIIEYIAPKFECRNSKDGTVMDLWHNNKFSDFEIIGNIYENPISRSK